jgi:PAS domain S-box-containing protein
MSQPLKCLIVEDSPSDALLLVEALRAAGFEPDWTRVETEEDYLTGLGDGPEIVFSDFNLPRFSAGESIRLLKESRVDIPLILVSGTIGEERAVQTLLAGATDYILKDNMERLGAAVRRAKNEFQERNNRRAAEETLRASEERFRQFAESINEVFWLSDPATGEILYLSPAFQTIWGGDPAARLPVPSSWPDQVHAEDQERVAQTLARRVADGGNTETYRIVRPDGAVRWIHDRAFPVKDTAGRVTRIAGVAEDITEQRQLEEQFRQAQKMESVGQLAGGVAHDFNNLLTVIQGHASLMLAEGDIPAHWTDSVEQISIAAERAAALTRQLLTFSRKRAIAVRTVDLNRLVDEMNRMLSRMLGEDIEIEFVRASPLPPILADTGMLEQVLMNLVINARDAMPRGGRLIVATSLEEIGPEHRALNPDAEPGPHACLSVTDTGMGMPRETQLRIFEPFFTTKLPGKGTGLGLATVHGIVRQHRGWISVYSEVGHGTVFRVYFPTAPEGSAVESGPRDQLRPKGGDETILLVEDEPTLRALARVILERYGYRVLDAGTGVDALRVWREHRDRIDLLVTDMIMPDGMTGLELYQTIHREAPALPVVITSGYSPEVFPAHDHAVPDAQFVHKPFTSVRLAASVRHALDSAGPRPAGS